VHAQAFCGTGRCAVGSDTAPVVIKTRIGWSANASSTAGYKAVNRPIVPATDPKLT
jgi:hypothetical protein